MKNLGFSGFTQRRVSDGVDVDLPLICEMKENVLCGNCSTSSLFVAEDEIDPFMQMLAHVFRLCTEKVTSTTQDDVSGKCNAAPNASRWILIKSSGDFAQGGSFTSSTLSMDKTKESKDVYDEPLISLTECCPA